MSPRTFLRWLLIPFACFAAWYVALFVGITLLSITESFCPADEMVSGMCTAPWYRTVETAVFCFSTALSAVLVIATGFFVAPSQRPFAAWLSFSIGTLVAFYMAAALPGAWGLFASAVSAGIATVLLLNRSRFAATRNPSSAT